jgi:hypothetical protein
MLGDDGHITFIGTDDSGKKVTVVAACGQVSILPK